MLGPALALGAAAAALAATAAAASLPVVPAVAALAVLGLLHVVLAALRVEDGAMDGETLALLEGEQTAPFRPSRHREQRPAPECVAVAAAMNGAPPTDDEATSAQQMRGILAANHLAFRSLERDPGLLLQCSERMCSAAPGALWTRFTVSYNLYAGSIVALGSERQRAELYDAQGELGCFAFTEVGAGVLSGAGVETTATYDPETETFVIHSPGPTARKTWISQGMFAERAVILAELVVGGEKKGPHLFTARIANVAQDGAVRTVKGVTTTSLPGKVALRGLDNAYISFEQFAVPRTALLSRFCGVDKGGAYSLSLPAGADRMLDVLISRLMTGRICLSECTVGYAMALLRRSWSHCAARELWRGRKPSGPLMSSMPLIRSGFRDYGRSLAVVAAFIRHTREAVSEAIRTDVFPAELVEATCMCKFLGTGFGVDAISACRKLLGTRALQADSWLGDASFVANATCAAEGDNTVMELKVCQDMVRGRTARLPWGLFARTCGSACGRRAARIYLARFGRAMLLQKRALKDGQLLKDLAWARLHLRVVDVWLQVANGAERGWLDSYERTLMAFPVPLTM